MNKFTFQLNAEASKDLCKILNKYGVRLLQIITNLFFNGQPYHAYYFDDNFDFISVYGVSKAKADIYIFNCHAHILFRNILIYSDSGKFF
tara:strand:+ start:99 stop:368 length:270 start_codon:yes stop_codon:yes gene_type:complete